MDSPLALYRRYRPETFAQVIGQEHVTGPLRNALAADRVNHAYLFSGPRGCGKTTSARILARSLNCAQAPVAEPCGECESCQELATGGRGSIDVIEIDAASHGGVDDARDLREKAFFAPVRDRYKIYIIDEAHMVTPQGFNALLKLVEEPPPHLRFIFATTAPDKVLPTIRSRTHHYPFRLIPPRMLAEYLVELCAREGVSIEPAAVPLVVRAGGDSARDTLSVLDQLIGGSGAEGVTYQLATALLGFTPDTLLDEVIDAWAVRDGAAVFSVVDKVIESGQDPHRFTEDLLRRLRDLVILSQVPDAPVTGLLDVSEDAGERLSAQAGRFGAAELSRAADLVASGLTEMRGATAPRLLLELICARVLLPGSDAAGLSARVDRLEKRLEIVGLPDGEGSPSVESGGPRGGAPAEPAAAAPPAAPPAAPAPSAAPAEQSASAEQSAPVEQTAPRTGPPRTSDFGLVDVRRLWPDIVDATKSRRRLAWMHLTQNCQVLGLEGNVLTLGFANPGARDSFRTSGCEEILRQAAIDVVGMDWTIETILDPGAQPDPGYRVTAPAAPPTAGPGPDPQPSVEQASVESGSVDPVSVEPGPAEPIGSPGTGEPEPPAPEPPAPEPRNPGPRNPEPREPGATESGPGDPGPGDSGPGESTHLAPQEQPAQPLTRPTAAPPDDDAQRPATSPQAGGAGSAREAIAATRSAGTAPAANPADAIADAAVDPDDPVQDSAGLLGAQLLADALGAEIVEEIPHETT